MKNKINYQEYIESHILRIDVSHRGGGIEVDAFEVLNIEGVKVSVYQNYLGGGMLGKVCSDNNLDVDNLNKKEIKILNELSEALKQYFHGLTRYEYDEWEDMEYEQNQNMPVSAY